MSSKPKRKSAPNIILSRSRDIPFNLLSLSQANVRHVKAGVSIEELAEDIARRGLLQGLSVRESLSDAGEPTGRFEIPAGGRRFRALELLAQQKRLADDEPIPCIVREGGIAEEDSLAENIQRAPLHPLDQFRAFLALRDKGQSEEEIAAAFFTTTGVVRQRLRLAGVSPRLLELYAEDALTLDQMMAFTVSPDHERQNQVYERLAHSFDKTPHTIRRLLTEGAVRASDRRARFIRTDAYEAEGGVLLRDLFQGDEGGWLTDVALVERMVEEKLRAEAEVVKAEGWRWVEVGVNLPYGYDFGMRQLRGEAPSISEEDEQKRAALQTEYDAIEAEYDEYEELPEEIDRALGELERELQAFVARPLEFTPEDKARAGVFISLTAEGGLDIERGYILPEDETPIGEPEEESPPAPSPGGPQEPGGAAPESEDEREEDGLRPLSDRLVQELTVFRTVALRSALGEDPPIAAFVLLHALALALFYPASTDSCLAITAKSVGLAAEPAGLSESPAAIALSARHQAWRNALPERSEDLWVGLTAFDSDSRQSLLAHCVGLTINALIEPYSRRVRALATADKVASAIGLDPVQAGWRPTREAYLGRVTKARILEAVREARGNEAADRIAQFKKEPMAEAAEVMLVGAGWLPELLRTLGTEPSSGDDTGFEVPETATATEVMAAE